MFLTLGVKRSDEVICRQSLLVEDTDVMKKLLLYATPNDDTGYPRGTRIKTSLSNR
jgi:hypothetical protein